MRKEVMSKHRHKRGFSLIELLLGTAIVTALAIGVLIVYNKTIKPGQYVREKVNAFSNLVAGLESVKLLNGNAYPIASSFVPLTIDNPANNTERLLVQAVGRNNGAYVRWEYTCNNNWLGIIINVGDTPDADLRESVRTAIRNNFAEFQCNPIAQNDPRFTCFRTNVACN